MTAAVAEPLIASGPVLLELRESVAHLRLNRPTSANAMNLELLEALRDALLLCHGDGRIRALLLTAAGRNFCGGGDVREFADQGDDLGPYLRKATTLLHAASSTMINLQAPVITAVQGNAAGGGGIGLVCSSDLVFAAESARFLQGVARVGMVPDAGTTVTLTRLIGQRRALELALTDRPLSAQEALALGLINEAVPDEQLIDRALAVATELAHGPTAALAASKRLIWRGASRTVEDAFIDEAHAQAALGTTADAHEGLAAVIEHRLPKFTGS